MLSIQLGWEEVVEGADNISHQYLGNNTLVLSNFKMDGVAAATGEVAEPVYPEAVLGTDILAGAITPNSHEVSRQIRLNKNGGGEWEWIGLNASGDLTGYTKMVATIVGPAGEKFLFKVNDQGSGEKWVDTTGEAQEVELVLPEGFAWDATKKTMILFANAGGAGTGHEFTITKLELQGDEKDAIDLLAGKIIIGSENYKVCREIIVTKPVTNTGEWDCVKLDLDGDFTGYAGVAYVVQGTAGEKLLIKVNDKEETWVTLDGSVQKGVAAFTGAFDESKSEMILFANPGTAGTGHAITISQLVFTPGKANVDLLADLPTSDADYQSPNWKVEKYTTAWEVQNSVQMRSRAKGDVRVANMANGYGMSMRYTFSNGHSLGLANKLSFKVGNYFSGAQDISVKVKIVLADGSEKFIAGDADNWVTIPVGTDLVDQALTFDDAEVKAIVFVTRSAMQGNAYLYIGDAHLTYEEAAAE